MGGWAKHGIKQSRAGRTSRVRRLAVITGAIVAFSALVAGCGNTESEEPLVETLPALTGTLSDESLANPAVHEVTQTREAVEAAGFGAAVVKIYELLNAAAKKADTDNAAGGQMLRENLPPLIAELRRTYPRAREAAQNSRAKTAMGRAMREVLLTVMDMQYASMVELGDRVANNPRTWTAVAAWGDTNNAAVQHARQQVEKAMSNVPASQRAAMEKAIAEAGG